MGPLLRRRFAPLAPPTSPPGRGSNSVAERQRKEPPACAGGSANNGRGDWIRTSAESARTRPGRTARSADRVASRETPSTAYPAQRAALEGGAMGPLLRRPRALRALVAYRPSRSLLGIQSRSANERSRQLALAAPRTMVGATGFEPATSWSRTKRATKLRYAPVQVEARMVPATAATATNGQAESGPKAPQHPSCRTPTSPRRRVW